MDMVFSFLIQMTSGEVTPEKYARNFQFLVYGLIAAWVLLVAYVVVLVNREHRLKRELDRVRQMIEDREKVRR